MKKKISICTITENDGRETILHFDDNNKIVAIYQYGINGKLEFSVNISTNSFVDIKTYDNKEDNAPLRFKDYDLIKSDEHFSTYKDLLGREVNIRFKD